MKPMMVDRPGRIKGLLVLAVACGLGCSAGNKVVVMPNYVDEYINDASLSLVVDQSQIRFSNREDAVKLFKDSAPEFAFHEMLAHNFVRQIQDKTAVSRAEFYEQADRSFLKQTRLFMGPGFLSMFLPDPNNLVEEISTDCILFLENIYTKNARSLTRGREEPTQYFVTEAEFAIWYSKYNELICYGTISAKSPNPYKKELADLEDDICESLVFEVFRQGPFGVKFDRVIE